MHETGATVTFADHRRVDSIVKVIRGFKLLPVHEAGLDDVDGMIRLNTILLRRYGIREE